MRAFEGSTLEFNVDEILKSMEYDIVVRYEPEYPSYSGEARVLITREDDVDPEGPCANWKPEDDELFVEISPNSRSAVATPSVCLEEKKTYVVHLEFRSSQGQTDNSPSASILVDSVSKLFLN